MRSSYSVYSGNSSITTVASLNDPTEEKRFYDMVVGALETYRAEVGTSPLQMPLGVPQSVLLPSHLKALGRILKDLRLCEHVETFQALNRDRWQALTGMGLKWILNGVHNNTSIKEFKVSDVAWTSMDGQRFIRFLNNSPHVTSVTFEKMTVGTDAAFKSFLKGMVDNRTVRHLSMKSTTFSETTFLMLVALVSENTTLESIDLQHCDFSYHNRAQRFIQAIIDNTSTKLSNIRWPLMRGAVIFMAQMLEYNKTISTIDLSGISLGPHVTLLQRALSQNRVLTSLNLSSTSLNDAHLAVLLEPLWSNDTLTDLDISANQHLTTESAKNIGDMLMQNTGIQVLNVSSISYNMGKDRLAKYIARALRSNSSIHTLKLSNTNTESHGGAFLGEVLAVNHSVHTLDLSQNPGFDDSALAGLLKHIRNNYGLKSLNLSNCKIGDGAVKTVVPWIKTTTVLTVRLNLSGNKMSPATNLAITEAVNSNPLLKNLILGNLSQTPSFYSRLKQEVLFFFQ